MALSSLDLLLKFIDKHPRIRVVLPSSQDFPALRSIWYNAAGDTPLGIVRPKTAQDVATIISFATANSLEIAVRSGGGDPYERGFRSNALTIDMRDIDHVHIDAEKREAVVGGGILNETVAKELEKEGFVTPVTVVGSVGYVGWATHGGYSTFNGNFGMGMDHILGATLINASGEMLDADEDMLRIIRGGGGTLGVITELRIKIYPLTKILAGTVLFRTTDLYATLRHYVGIYDVLKEEIEAAPLSILTLICNSPFGKVVGAMFVWSSSDLEKGQTYLKRVTSLDEPVLNTVTETTVPEWQETSAASLPQRLTGQKNISCVSAHTATDLSMSLKHHLAQRLYEFTPQVVNILSSAASSMPTDPGTLISIHHLRTPTLNDERASIFNCRRPHVLVEILATATKAENVEEARLWGCEVNTLCSKLDSLNREKAGYISLTSPFDGAIDWESVFGEENWKYIVEAKKKCDPTNVFKHAYIQFGRDELR